MNNHFRTVIFSIVIFVCALVVVFSWPQTLPHDARAMVAAAPICANIQPLLSLGAKAAYAKDLTTGNVLYEKNAHAQLALASLTKLATVATAFDILSPDDIVTITPQSLTPEGDAGLLVGEQWTAQNLTDYTLMVSANDGAHALALAAAAKAGTDLQGFIARMNQKAASLGMNETFFASDTGLDISSTTASAYGSAQNVATLIASLVEKNPRLLEGTHSEEKVFTSRSGFEHVAQNTSSVIGTLEGATASKTGFTDLAGGNLAVVFEPLPGRPVAAVVLGSTREGRDVDMQKLAESAKTALKRMLLCENGLGSP